MLKVGDKVRVAETSKCFAGEESYVLEIWEEGKRMRYVLAPNGTEGLEDHFWREGELVSVANIKTIHMYKLQESGNIKHEELICNERKDWYMLIRPSSEYGYNYVIEKDEIGKVIMSGISPLLFLEEQEEQKAIQSLIAYMDKRKEEIEISIDSKQIQLYRIESWREALWHKIKQNKEKTKEQNITEQ